MNLSRMQSIFLAAVFVMGGCRWMAGAQTPDAPPVAEVIVPPLDVISVKVNKAGGSGGSSWGPTPDGVMGKNITVHLMLVEGFHLSDKQIVNEPEWGESEHFDVSGKVSGQDAAAVGKLTPKQKEVYYQQVLRERFGLVTHHETRELPEYALVPAKGGVKIADGKPDPNAAPDMKRGKGWYRTGQKGDVKSIEFADAGIDPLLIMLSDETEKMVVDRAQMTGKYSFTLRWRETKAKAGADEAADSVPDLFTAIQEQLGLKLEPAKGPVDVVVIDHLERPGEN